GEDAPFLWVFPALIWVNRARDVPRAPYSLQRLLRHQQTLREAPLVLDPLMAAHEAGIVGNRGQFLRAVLVAALGPDRLTFLQGPRQLPRAHLRGHVARRAQMHLE